MDIREKLRNIFAEMGVFIDEDEGDAELNIDSLQFINIILEIEETFSMTVDEDFMLIEKLNSLNAFEKMVKETIELV